VLVKSQAEKIVGLEAAYADLNHEKESITAGYRRLSEKHKMFTKKTEWEKTELRGDLDLETHSYTEYRLNVSHRLRKLHETMASSFDEIQVWCLPFPGRGAKIEEMIDWVAGEVKTMLDTVWQLNDIFAVLAIKGVLSMLNDKGCQELGRNAAVLQNVPEDMRKLAGWIVIKWWKPHGLPEALRRLGVANAMTVSDTNN
jgi:hypothetical protein